MEETNAPDPEDLKFSSALEELEGIVRELESGQLDLEDGIQRYERGVALLRICRTKLEDAQQKITTLMGELDLDADTEGAEDE